MPAVLVTIGVYIISSVIAKILVALGIGIFTYYGLLALVEQIVQQAQIAFGGLPAQASQVLSIAGIPEALSILCSAFVTRASIQAIKTFFGTRT
jgi:DNA-binding transcriptional MocR family regulator